MTRLFLNIRLFGLSVLLVLIALMAGCSGSVPMHRVMTPLPEGASCRVAVLPFQNDSDFPMGDVLVQKVFAAQLPTMGNHVIIQEGDIAKAYQQLHLLPGESPVLEQYQIIADRVGAPLLLTGIILEMREERSEHQTVNPFIIMEVQLKDGRNGETLWKTFHRRKGTDYKKTMHFGTIHTLTGLSRQMAEEIFNLWYKKGFAPCNG